ncbi:acyl carrier protein-like [Halichondria panicea]|uniref:acyl carrier protein-like n=1 Tax=Halichondria panicea TaxID=6063 RepID=UPI00312B7145
MASRALVRVASSTRPLLTRVRPSAQWRHLSAVPIWRSKTPTTSITSYKWTPSLIGWQQTRGMASDELTVSDLEDRAQQVLKLFDKVDPAKVTLEAHFTNDLGLDSLDAVEVVMAFEDEFGIEISDEDAEKILSAKDAVDFLKNALDVH